MSNIYVLEPPTSGKVLLITSVGEIDVELWSKEAPKACRNFVQLCMEGYYNSTIFHRVIPGFIAQGGDPEATGHGGESIYEKPFADEFHSRIRFTRRGLVAMANSAPNSNGSQFFFTLGASPELNNKHTIFGRVVGDTLYNMIKLGEADTDKDDRPLYPQKIIKTEILDNPFPDIIPRVDTMKSAAQGSATKEKESHSRATKNFKLLSFGEEAEEDEDDLVRTVPSVQHPKGKSSHDLLNDKTLSSMRAIPDDIELQEDLGPDQDLKTVTESIRQKLKRTKDIDKHDKPTLPDLFDAKSKVEESTEKPKKKKSKVEETGKSQAAPPTNDKNDKLAQKKKHSDREAQTLAMMAKFKSILESSKDTEESPSKEKHEGSGDEEDEDYTGTGWMSNKLVFEEHEQKVKDASVNDADRYEIFDPRNPMNVRRRAKPS